jgi:peroxiredoxin
MCRVGLWSSVIALMVAGFLSVAASGCGGHGAGGGFAGTLARSFTLRSMARIEVNTAEQVGKRIVVLHFWSTFSTDCGEGLEALGKIGKDYWNHPVKVYAVNVGESRETVRDYLKAAGLTVTVLLDEEKSAAALYGVEDLPVTVIVGRSGFIQHVGAGLGYGYERALREDLNTLLRGELLVKIGG